MGFYNGVQVVFKRCHDSFEMLVMTKTSLPHIKKWHAVLSLTHKTTVALLLFCVPQCGDESSSEISTYADF